MSISLRLRCLFVLLVIVALIQPANAQVLYGSVVGLVEDPSGSTVPNATITLTNKGTGVSQETKSDEGGRFSMPNLLPGRYDLKVVSSGFRTYTETDINIEANIVTRSNVRMELGNVSEQVTVQAEATQLQTDKSDTHSTITTQAITELPLPGYRNYQSLMNLVPGATPTRFQNSPTDTPGRALATNVNGTNANNNVTRIDGAASINVWLPHHVGYVMPTEMIETVNVTTSAADAEIGFSGGAAVTLITKSGTNEIHGSAFEFHNNQRLNARPFFLNPARKKPVSIYNNYGATLGGPFIKNKLFWFVSFDGTRERVSNIGDFTVPTAAMKNGDFSQFLPTSAGGTCSGSSNCTIIYDPMTGNPDGTGRVPFQGNRIPGNRIHPASAKIQAYFPNPTNLAALAANFQGSAVRRIDRDYFDYKGNWNRNERHQFNGHYGRMWATSGGIGLFGDAVGPAPGTDPGLGDTVIQNTSVAHTYTFSPTVLLDGVFGYQRQNQTVKGQDFGKNFSDILGIPGINGPDERSSGFPNVSISGFQGMGVPGWMPLFRVEENFTTSHNLTINRGAHEMRFGYDGVLLRLDHWQPELGAGPRGQLQFNGGITGLNGGAIAPNNFNAYAAFLLGLPYQMQKSIQYITMTGNEFQHGLYFRDRWQVNRRLTLNLGLRWEYYPLMTRDTGKGIERLDPETNTVFLGGYGDVPRDNGIKVSKRLFAPRVGIALRATENTVIRTGYGINYSPLPFSRPLRGFYPLTVNFNFEAPTSWQWYRTLSQGIPDVQGPDLSTGRVQLPGVADMRTPGDVTRGYIQSWNFTVEHKLPADIVGSVGYVGTKTTGQLADLDINAATPPAPGQPGPGQAGRPYASRFNRRTATNLWSSYLSSNYHSLQATVNKQFSHGLMMKGAYTWSKAINFADDEGWQGVMWNHPSNFYRNRAPSSWDRTHVFQIGWVYELPFGRGKQWMNSGPASWIVGNWQINGTMAAYTGRPFNLSGGAALNTPGSSQTPDQVGELKKLGGVGTGMWFYDPTAFRAVAEPGRFGTVGRNAVRGPGLWNTDLSVFREIPVSERANVQLRGEFLNFTNTPHFDNPSGDSTSANFMRVTSAFGERQIRLGIRVGF